MTVLIKRYANRKLYNTATSRYITLKGIAELIEQGEDVRVIDNESGEDITSVALSQILVDNERGGRAMSRSLLSDLIQRSGDALYGALKRGVEDASDGIEGIQRNVQRAIRSREEDAQRLRAAWRSIRSEWDEGIQLAIERVFRALELPRRSDIEALNQNLERVADALDRLHATGGDEPEEPSRDTAPPASEPRD
ncbi:MAG: polyhydroxyalkanoate synthesis regulator DNA-binding domain-containing protein [Myxococcales bacterium]|nr:polyhydroxyalkanoate synthesis regulator DNA-binding domain-containing protein [Myxococcales bacterium]